MLKLNVKSKSPLTGKVNQKLKEIAKTADAIAKAGKKTSGNSAAYNEALKNIGAIKIPTSKELTDALKAHGNTGKVELKPSKTPFIVTMKDDDPDGLDDIVDSTTDEGYVIAHKEVYAEVAKNELDGLIDPKKVYLDVAVEGSDKTVYHTFDPSSIATAKISSSQIEMPNVPTIPGVKQMIKEAIDTAQITKEEGLLSFTNMELIVELANRGWVDSVDVAASSGAKEVRVVISVDVKNTDAEEVGKLGILVMTV